MWERKLNKESDALESQATKVGYQETPNRINNTQSNLNPKLKPQTAQLPSSNPPKETARINPHPTYLKKLQE